MSYPQKSRSNDRAITHARQRNFTSKRARLNNRFTSHKMVRNDSEEHIDYSVSTETLNRQLYYLCFGLRVKILGEKLPSPDVVQFFGLRLKVS